MAIEEDNGIELEEKIPSDEEEGDDAMKSDSSEEESDDEEEAKRIADGFIVGDDEDEGEDGDGDERRSKKRRRKDKKKKKRRRREADADEGDSGLDEDDLELLAENTGKSRDSGLRRLQHRRGATEDFDDDEVPTGDLDRIFEQEARRRDRDEDDLDDFIEEDYGDDEEPESRKQQRKSAAEKLKQSSKTGISFTAGMDKAVWDEVNEIFDCSEYEGALDYEDEHADQTLMGDSTTVAELAKVFEPSALASRLLTAADEAIRAIDAPERVQLACRSLLSSSSNPVIGQILQKSQVQSAVAWIAPRISERTRRLFYDTNSYGDLPQLRGFFLDAVDAIVDALAVSSFDVPFVFTYRQDLLQVQTHEAGTGSQEAFLNLQELWKIDGLILKYRALIDKKESLQVLQGRVANLPSSDDDGMGMPPDEERYFTQMYGWAEQPEDVADLTDWLRTKYGARLRQNRQDDAALNEGLEDDIDGMEIGEGRSHTNGKGLQRFKRAVRTTRHERARASKLAQFAQVIAMPARELAKDYKTRQRSNYVDDPAQSPEDIAEQYATVGTEFHNAPTVLEGVAELLAQDLALDPQLRKVMRDRFRKEALISIKPTPGKGMQAIDEMHPYYSFKYLKDKPATAFKQSTQFLSILKAESEGLIELTIQLPGDSLGRVASDLTTFYQSDYKGFIADKWNQFREKVVDSALRYFLLPLGARAVKESLREEAEEVLLAVCEEFLERRVNVRPFQSPRMKAEEGHPTTPSVLAISNGYGDPKRDHIYAIFMDRHGIFREHLTVDNLRDDSHRDKLSEFIKRRNPDAVVVGGFSQSAHRLKNDVQAITTAVSESIAFEYRTDNEPPLDAESARILSDIPVILVYDDIARLYQHTDRAKEEFPDVPELFRYCVALARYCQSPLNEYAALGSDLTAVTYHPNQTLLNKETLQLRLERVLIDIVNSVGVDINKAVHNSYYGKLLPFVCGLGPRKAQSLISQISSKCKGTLISREVMITKGLVTPSVFMNCSAFLRIPKTERIISASAIDDEDSKLLPDILDTTRVHSEDYDIARKMAQDALELDEEDLQTLSHPSDVIKLIMEEDHNKLDDLSLDDFARDLYELRSTRKLYTLIQIKQELAQPFADKREEFRLPTLEEAFSMLTGETKQTLKEGFIVPVKVQAPRKDGTYGARLDSGLEGFFNTGYTENLDDPTSADPTGGWFVGRTIQAQVIRIDYERFLVELSALSEYVRVGDKQQREIAPDRYFDRIQAAHDREVADAKSKKGAARGRRMINHPNFHNFNAAQAEEFLANQQRGDCVVRPSSKGNDHLALTWKVDTGVYSHLDVLELDKPSEYQLGQRLRVGSSNHTYQDLDELIFSHVRAIAKKCEEMMSHDKYKGDEESLSAFLSRSLMADPNKSVYGFAIDKRPGRAGNFLVGFRANQNTQMSTWPVIVVPRAFRLRETEVPDMTTLCNSFKTQYMVFSAERAKHSHPNGGPQQQHPSRTPAYGAGGRTPNAYGYQRPPTNNPYAGGQTPAWGGYASSSQTPRPQYGYR